MTRENSAQKAARYLAEGRLVVTSVFADDRGTYVAARCRGDGEIYQLGHHPRRGWHRNCPARTAGCCHLVALRLVVSAGRSA
jgi:hypothetical protein